MIRALGAVFRATGNEYTPVNCLNTTKPDRNVELSQKLFSSFSIIVNIVVRDAFLVKLKKVDSVERHRRLGNILQA